ncbi:hypothetical protein JW824_00145 [bacterium]|nr:hypothetical protein [bacterium]
MAMVLSYRDYEGQMGGGSTGKYTSYGKIIEYYIDETTAEFYVGSDGVNFRWEHNDVNPARPKLIVELAWAMNTKGASGGTYWIDMVPGVNDLMLQKGYGSSWASDDYTSVWDLFQNEIDSNRPALLDIENHSLCGWGYSDTEDEAFTYDTWHDYRSDYDKDLLLHIVKIVPNNGHYLEDIELKNPDGEEYLTGGTIFSISWYQFTGSLIDNVDIYFSQDGGKNFSAIETWVTSSPGSNNYSWEVPNTNVSRARIRLEGWDGGSSYLSGDGSRLNFNIQTGSTTTTTRSTSTTRTTTTSYSTTTSRTTTSTRTTTTSQTTSTTRTTTTIPGGSSQLFNLSTRAYVGNGYADIPIGGLIVKGSQSKKVVFHGLGPWIHDQDPNINDYLRDPTLTLFRNSTQVAYNDDWTSLPSADKAVLSAFGLTPGYNTESAIVYDVNEGYNWTVHLKGLNNTTGIGLVAIYDVSSNSTVYLCNLSTRAYVGNGYADIPIGGLILNGSQSKKVVIHGLGPWVHDMDPNISDYLQDPTLTLFRGSTQVAFNDDWTSLSSADKAVLSSHGLTPGHSTEAAIVYDVYEGYNWTVHLKGYGNGTGIGLVAIYDVDVLD